MKVKSLVNGIPLQYVVVDGGAEGTLCLRPSGDSCSVRRYGKVASYSVVSWEEAQETVEDFVASAGGAVSPTSTAVHIQWAGISAAMAAVAEFGMVYIQNGDVGVETTYAGKGKVRLWSYGIADAVAPKEAIHLRDLRSWLSERFPEPSTVPWERQAPRANSIAEWLAEHAEQGVFEVDTRDQEVPLYLRAGHSLADWRFAEGRKVLDASSLGPADLAKMARNVGGQECRALRIDVTQNFGWTRGMFGDAGSCWWGRHNASRSLLYHAGGFAVRLWNSEHGVGRIWACPTQDGGVVLFNAYGPWTSEGAAALLEHVTGIPLWPTTAVTGSWEVYINPTTAFVGDVQQAQEYTALVPMPCAPLAWTRNTSDWEPGDPVTEETLRRPPLHERGNAPASVKAIWPHADLRRANLRGADLRRNDARGVVLKRADLEGATLDGSDLVLADLTGANLDRASLVDVNAERSSFSATRLASANLSGTNLDIASLARADARDANLDNALACAMHASSLYAPRLSARSLQAQRAVFHCAVLRRADLTGAYLERSSFYAAELEGACLEAADLRSATLRLALLDGANLAMSNLEYADLRECVAVGACVVGARLNNADLSGADLRGADLGGTDLRGADLTRANLTGVNLHGARWDQTTIWPEGFVPTAW